MGQYYKVIILAENGTCKKEFIRVFINISGGIKLMEHSYLKNDFVNRIEFLLSLEGSFYKSRIVWAGDYADPEDESNKDEKNLYNIADDESDKEYILKSSTTLNPEYKYIVNHTKKQYINKTKLESRIHPLPLLTAEGNGRGGGDYRGTDEIFVGQWSRDIISIEKEVPLDYNEITPNFGE